MEQSKLPILTVVLAAKDPDPAQFDACVASIAALRNSYRFDLVIVASGKVPTVCDSFRVRLHHVLMLEQEPRGVYQAYNAGLGHIETPYVLVLGCDDLLLPGLDRVIDS